MHVRRLQPSADPKEGRDTTDTTGPCAASRHGFDPWPLAASAAPGVLAAVFGLALATSTNGQVLPDGDQLRLSYAPKAFHVTHSDDYVDWNHIVALEWVMPRHQIWGADRTHLGVSLFDNSYGQFSQSVYAGLEWDWTQAFGGEVFVALSLGLVHGYKEPYEDKLPLNDALGVGVTLVPAIAWQRGAFGLAASLAGSAVVFRVSYSFAP